jgi:hypothetical protein
MRSFTILSILLVAVSGSIGCSSSRADDRDGAAGKLSCDGARCDGRCTDSAVSSLADIGQLVVIYLENRSFDHLYGSYPGAEGLSSSGRGAGFSGPQHDLKGLPEPRRRDSLGEYGEYLLQKRRLAPDRGEEGNRFRRTAARRASMKSSSSGCAATREICGTPFL